MAKSQPPAEPGGEYTRMLESYFEMREEEDRLASARAALTRRLHQVRHEAKGREAGEQIGRTAARIEAAEAARAKGTN